MQGGPQSSSTLNTFGSDRLFGEPSDQLGASPVAQEVKKKSTCNAGDIGDEGSIPGLGRSPEEEIETHSSILAWVIPWTEEPGGL